MPAERSGFLSVRIPDEEHHDAHHSALVDVVPALDGHLVHGEAVRIHQELVVESAEGSENRRADNGIDPDIMFKVNSFLLSATAQHEERHHGQQHACPLEPVQFLTEDQHRADQDEDRAGGVDRANYRDQMTFGFSRDDVGTFMGEYLGNKILDADPFQTIDTKSVGKLVEFGIQAGRSKRPDLKCGVCGEHGGDPASIRFFNKIGVDYVSCSPFRVPIARLAAAQAAIEQSK